MAGLFNILKVTVSEDKICAHVLVNPGMPLMTSEANIIVPRPEEKIIFPFWMELSLISPSKISP